MAQLEVKNVSGQSVGTVELSDEVFGGEVNEHLLWEAVKWQLAKRRRGTHSTKTRGEVRATKKKAYKQKGTGRARHGSERAPVFVGGGVAFGPKPRSYDYPFPKKARKQALRSALSLRMQEGKLVVVDELAIAGGKTRVVATALANLGAPQPDASALVVDAKDNEDLVRGTRNLRASKWLAPEGLNVYDILNHETLIVSQASAKAIEQALTR
ncbi:MAG TPA: 50S ribosomal protein L4 [Kofleriaceae bacterium]|nr:50S ribosomal protein L4 [Kofleriaceae bacterium]